MWAVVAHVLLLMFCKSSLRQVFEVVLCYAFLFDVKIDLKNRRFGQRETL